MNPDKIQEIKKLYQAVPPSELTAREQQMLALINFDKTVKNFPPLAPGRYRILQFDSPNFSDLAQNLRLLLPDFAQADPENQLIFERFSGDNMTVLSAGRFSPSPSNVVRSDCIAR